MSRPLRMLLPAALLAIATVASYAPVFSAGFADIDDADFVVENEHVLAGIEGAGVVWAFREAHASNWIPLTWLSHMLDVELFGVDPSGHHAVNVALHVANALLLFAGLASLTGAALPSFAVAALFALHPANVESVAWIAQRKTVLSTCFGLLAIGAWARHVRRGGRGARAASLAAFACSLLAKPTLVTLPFALLLLDVWPLRRTARGWRRLVAEKLPFLALAAAASVATLLAQREAIATGETFPLPVRLGNAVLSYARYLELWAWPAQLAVYRPLYEDEVRFAPVAACAAALLAITAAVLWARRERAYLAVGWLWFVGTLVPVIGAVQVGAQAMAERYVYAPFWGLHVALVWLVWSGARGSFPRRAAAACCLAVCAGFAVLTWRQAERWQDSIALLEGAVAATGRNYVAERALAAHYLRRGDPLRALAHAERGAQHARARGEVLPIQAMALYQTGAKDEAFAKLEEATRLAPDNALAFSNLGWMLLQEGDARRASEALARAVELDPSQGPWHLLRGRSRLALGQLDAAERDFAAAVERAPLNFDARIEWARALARQGRFADAEGALEDAIAAAPAFDEERRALLVATLQQYLGDARAARGDRAGAAAAYEASIAGAPQRYAPHASLALLLANAEEAALHDPERAVQLAERAAALSQRRQPDALAVLALVYAAAGRAEDAARSADEARAIARATGGEAALAAIEARLGALASGR